MLYIVGTPIGNLGDLSLRQATTLAQSDIILSEDTRSTGMLLQKLPELFNITIKPDQKLVSYYKEKEFEKLPQVMEWLEEEKIISLISQAGMPLISDPGLLLVKTAIKRQIPFTVIPGPTAYTTALAYSGFNPQYSMFLGFLPKKESELKKLLEKMKSIKQFVPETVFVFYESPQRIHKTLELIQMTLPDVVVSIGRELTKKFEEIIRGTSEELMKREYRGEITVVVS